MACRRFEPDHNGECLNCDDWYEAHSMYMIAGSGRFILFRTKGCITMSPDDPGHREAARHDAAELLNSLDGLLKVPDILPEAFVVQVLGDCETGVPRFVVLEQLQLFEPPQAAAGSTEP